MKKPSKCPQCGAADIWTVEYGYFAGYDEDLKRDLEKRKVLLGGCVVEEDPVEFVCKGCGWER